MPEPFHVLVLGGYGLFGGRAAARLAAEPGWHVTVAGRDAAAAETFCAAIARRGPLQAELRAQALDAQSADFAAQLARLAPQLVIHAGGPFQGQDYHVAEAAIAAGAHYIDLADGRDFVAGIVRLDAPARAADRLVVSGASTVPALSAAVLDALLARLAQPHSADVAISPGNRTPRGLATVAAILSYVGRPFDWWEGGRWRRVHGWQRLQRRRWPAPIGVRWLAACDVPDLTLLPPRYPALATLRFRAGLELRRLHFGLWLAGGLRRAGLAGDWSRHAAALKRWSERLGRGGSDAGAMAVEVRGRDADGHALRGAWELIARAGDGPQIPATAAVLLARRLAQGRLTQRGARPCLGLLTLADFEAEFAHFAIDTTAYWRRH